MVITPQAELLPTDDAFAPDIISQVKKAVIDELDGQAGWRVVSVNQNGVDVDVLNEVPGEPAPSVTISLDRAVQDAAQHAVNTTGKKAMIVVIKPSTGEILAVAQNAAADADGPAATTGLYPPGSTFKIITAGAAIDRDMATPNTLLGCPGRMDIGHRTVPNYGGFDLGTVPMSRAFASSCNTTFAELASRMPPRGADDGRRPVRHRARLRRSRASPRCPARCRRRSTWPNAPRTASARARCWSARSAWRWPRRPWRPGKRLCRN